MLFAGREVRIGKNCARGLEYVLKTKGTDFPNTDRPRSANNVFIFFCGKLLYKKYLCWFFTEAVSHRARAFDVSDFLRLDNKIHFRYDSCHYPNP